MAAIFFHGSKFRGQFLKRVTQGIILWNYFKIWRAVSEEKNFEESLWSQHSEKAPPTADMFFHRSKFRKQFLKRVTQGTFLWKYFKIRPGVSEKIFKEFLHVSIVQKVSLPNGGHVFPQIKISRTIFEKGHQRNNPVKLFQNLTSSFRGEEFCEKSLPPWGHVFWRIKTLEQFLKRVTLRTILWNYFKIEHAVSEEKIFNEFLKKFRLVAMATRVFDRIKFFKEDHPCNIPAKFGSNWPSGLGGVDV